MGEGDDRKRPGFDYWMSLKGKGDYLDTEFNVDGTRKVIKGYYTTVVTDATIDCGPLYGQKEYGKFVRAYLGTIASINDSMGRLYQTLKDAILPINTAIAKNI